MNHRAVKHASKRKCRNLPNCPWGNQCWFKHDMDLSVNHDNEEEIQDTNPPEHLEFKCRSCNESFNSKNQLMKHRKTKHMQHVRPCMLYLGGKCTRNMEQCWYAHGQGVQVNQHTTNPNLNPTPILNVDFPPLPSTQDPPDQITLLTTIVHQMQMNQMKMQEKLEQMSQLSRV